MLSTPRGEHSSEGIRKAFAPVSVLGLVIVGSRQLIFSCGVQSWLSWFPVHIIFQNFNNGDTIVDLNQLYVETGSANNQSLLSGSFATLLTVITRISPGVGSRNFTALLSSTALTQESLDCCLVFLFLVYASGTRHKQDAPITLDRSRNMVMPFCRLAFVVIPQSPRYSVSGPDVRGATWSKLGRSGILVDVVLTRSSHSVHIFPVIVFSSSTIIQIILTPTIQSIVH